MFSICFAAVASAFWVARASLRTTVKTNAVSVMVQTLVLDAMDKPTVEK